jgi:Flp pilus assembly protein TadD
VIRVGILIVALVGLGILYEAFLAPSPQDRARYEYESLASSLISGGDLEGALDQVEKGLAVVPGSTELLVLKGVLQQSLGRQVEAERTFADAQAAIADPKLFYLQRGQDYISVGNIDAAIADAQAALEVNPDSPEAYLLLGQGYEYLERFAEAVENYEKASTLADQQNRPDLTALARIRLAYLMQRGPGRSVYPSPES